MWFADVPTDDGAQGLGVVLVVEIPTALLSAYELPVTAVFKARARPRQRYERWNQ